MITQLDFSFPIIFWYLNWAKIQVESITKDCVAFTFTGKLGDLGDFLYLHLADPSYSINDKTTLIEYTGLDGTPQEIYACSTVTKAKAIEVATHFFYNRTPPPGSTWHMGTEYYTFEDS